MKPEEIEFLYLTTSGRRSGQPREIEIWFTQRDGCYYVVAEHRWEAQWVQNVIAKPHVSVRVGEKQFAARARVIDEDKEPLLHEAAQALSEQKYGWGDGLVVELRPE